MVLDTSLSGSVLVADDDFDSRELLADLLRHEFPNVGVATAQDGAEALRVVLRHRPWAVILDLEMPILDGIGAARAIRTDLGAAAPMLLAISGSALKMAQAQAQALFDHCLMKPVSIPSLLEDLRGRYLDLETRPAPPSRSQAG
jgi:CheY-like chemotaxis protein